ncbi:MAG: hypothetical protein ACK4J1_10145, partial [Hylemonella sp.]
CQAISRGAGAFGLQAQVLGCQQQVIDPRGFVGRPAELVGQSGRVGGDLVEAGDGAEGLQGTTQGIYVSGALGTIRLF